MNTDRELDEILAEIGREHRAVSAPEKLEPFLCAAAGDGKYASGTPRFRWAFAAVLILLAALSAAGILWQTGRTRRPQNPQVRSAPQPPVRLEPALPPEQVAEPRNVSAKSASVRNPARNRARHTGLPQQQATWNSLDEFIPLPASEGLPPAAEMSVIRITLSGSDLQQYGLEAPADAVTQTLLAEFVVGEDGLPRAIRIVR